MSLLNDIYEGVTEKKDCRDCKHCGDYEAWENGLVYETDMCDSCCDKEKWEIKEV